MTNSTESNPASSFSSPVEAKQFLADCIAAQAEREETPLSELERKMLLWSEPQDSLSDWEEVNKAFDKEYDSVEYEENIAWLIHRFREYAPSHQPQEWQRWESALRTIDGKDHYILVMVSMSDTARPPSATGPESPSWWERRSFAQLAMIGGAATLLIYLLIIAWSRLRQ